ncbi:MAG: hypothetical protein GKR94_30560 [Gammaproteobacteria bacterium]|nr:hypothetical protein [Gammaproteobacteria bacterium]
MIEAHTGIDALVSSSGAGNEAEARTPLRLSYLSGWLLAPALLFTAGYLAMSAARIGGQLTVGGRRGGR